MPREVPMTNVTGRNYGTHLPGNGRTLCKRYRCQDVNIVPNVRDTSCKLCLRRAVPRGSFAVEQHGGITKITPRTNAARQWLETNTDAEIWQWQDGALVVDTRAAAELLETIERRER